MPRFDKLREAIHMITHRKNFKKVSIDLLRENKRYEDVLRYEKDLLEDKFKKLEEKHKTTVDLAATLIDENRALKKKIEEYERSINNRFDILDL